MNGLNLWTCPNCGTVNTNIFSNGEHQCFICGYSESKTDYKMRINSQSGTTATPYTPPTTPLINQPMNTPPNTPPYEFGKTGWICPKCGRGVSPFVDVCPCQNYNNTVIYSTNTTF